MKGSIFAVMVAAGLASAQFSGIPTCAVPCLTSAISAVGCPAADVGCQCTSTAAIQAAGAGCILGACTAPGEIQSALSGGQALCSRYFATVSAGQTTSAEATTTLSSTSTATSTVTVGTTDIPSPTVTPTATTSAVGTVGTTSTRATPSPSVSQVPVGAGEKVKVAVGLGGVLGLGVVMLAL